MWWGAQRWEQLPFLETYDMTLEAVLAKIMWILGLHMEDRKEIERLFYKRSITICFETSKPFG